jgi:hypothetical protein
LRRKKPDDGPAEVDVPALTAHLFAEAARLETAEPEPDLLRARLADACRDAGLDSPDPDVFAARADPLDADGRRRLALAVAACATPALRPALARAGADAVLAGVAGLAEALTLLTASLLRQSGLRTEEFARHLAAGLNAGVKGETPEQSQARLERLDYARLLADAESAKQAAEARMAELRKRQEQAEARRTRRGKW